MKLRFSARCSTGVALHLLTLGWAGAADADPALPPVAPTATDAVSADGVPQAESPARHLGDGLIRGWQWSDSGLEYELGSSGRVSRVQARHPDADVAPYRGRLGLKLHLDSARYQTGSDLEEIPDDGGVRRARLYTTGSLFLALPVFYKVEAEVADRDFYVRETYVSLADVPLLQTLKVGFFKAPMTLEGYAAAGDTLFLERASPVEAFGPGVLYGVQPSGTVADNRMTWACGWFADGGQNDVSEASTSLTRIVGRLTGVPAYEDQAGSLRMVHVGASAQYLYSSESSVRYRSRPESYFAPRLVDTGDIDARNAVSWGAEVAAVRGPLSVQSEMLQATVAQEDNVTLAFYGLYVSGSWFLTGENRPYNRKTGVFGHVVPRRKFSLLDGSFGGWELVVRLSRLDLDDQDVAGGTMSLASLGLNGYLSTRFRIMLDYSQGRVDHDGNEGDVRIFGGRVQYEF